jgi:hypothetical protein
VEEVLDLEQEQVVQVVLVVVVMVLVEMNHPPHKLLLEMEQQILEEELVEEEIVFQQILEEVQEVQESLS